MQSASVLEDRDAVPLDLDGKRGPRHELGFYLARLEIRHVPKLDSFLTFYGPGGFAPPDDVEALEPGWLEDLAGWMSVPGDWRVPKTR